MSSAFTNFLSFTDNTILRDYQHANRLYVTSNYAKTPKFGFIYFVQFNINQDLVIDKQWDTFKNEVGLLAKKADLPKFTISTDTLNQYNRKTVVQTKVTYNPVTIELHDDNSNLTHNLWLNYFKHYYADSNYNDPNVSRVSGNNIPDAFRNTKWQSQHFTYGRYSRNKSVEFFSSIEIYVMNRGQFTKYTLVNPKITEWAHDEVNQSESSKLLRNRITIAYETVFYDSGEIVPGTTPETWTANYYDNAGSPLSIAGNIRNTPSYTRAESAFDQPGTDRVFGKNGSPQAATSENPLLSIGKVLAKNYLNRKGLGNLGPVGYNIAGGVLGALGNSGAGKYASAPQGQNQPGILNLPGGAGINLFKALNTSVDGKIRANPAALIFPKK